MAAFDRLRPLFLAGLAIFLMGAQRPQFADVPDPGVSPNVEGHWFFYKKVFRGIVMPEPPEATLRLHYSFTADGQSRLWWWHEGENDLCERKGEFRIEGNRIVDKITWVNPKNHRDCRADPDMQAGRTSSTEFSLSQEGDLQIHLSLGDDPLIYVWKKIPNN